MYDIRSLVSPNLEITFELTLEAVARDLVNESLSLNSDSVKRFAARYRLPVGNDSNDPIAHAIFVRCAYPGNAKRIFETTQKAWDEYKSLFRCAGVQLRI